MNCKLLHRSTTKPGDIRARRDGPQGGSMRADMRYVAAARRG
jgi:hypothetical protein